jgi:hypothetical protein
MTRSAEIMTALLLAGGATLAGGAPTGTAFTYQGRMLENGTPPTGAYDLEFTMYDVPVGGVPVLPPVTVEDVAVSGGLFTVSLDFGAAAFTGEARFMDIGVRPGASTGPFTLLSGRQELRPTPNALAAPWAGVHGKPAGFADDVDDDVLGSISCAAGEVAKWNGSAWACAADADSGGDITDVQAAPGGGLAGGASSGSASLGLLTSCPASQVLKWNGSAWACAADADSGGDITDVTAGAGLSGGGAAGAVSLQANFGGSGAASTISRSDHDHFGGTWTGSTGNGLLIQNSSAVNFSSGLRGSATAATGNTYGVYGSSASGSGTGVYGTAPNVAVQGVATATSGFAFGVLGSIATDQGAALQGYASASTGGAAGVYGISSSTGPGGVGVIGQAQASTGIVYGVYGQTYSPTGVGVYGWNQATGGTAYGVFGQSGSTAGSGVYGWATGSSGANYGVYGSSVSSAGRGVFGHAPSSVGTTNGVYGNNNSTVGRGVYGVTTATEGVSIGVYGRSSSSVGRAIYAEAASSVGDNWGIQAITFSPDGAAISGHANSTGAGGYGVQGSSNGSSGVGTSGAGNLYGVYGFSGSSTGTAVYGWNQSFTGATYGVSGLVYSTNGTALYGSSTATSGPANGVFALVSSTTGRAVEGWAQATSGVNIGVYGLTNSTAGYAGYFSGRVHVNGTLSKSAGSFKIDHPLDPENKYLSHSFVESPDMKNVYDGVVTTNAAGYATVVLPDWFEALNRDLRYQLTVIDEGDRFALAKVAREVEGNRFLVRTSQGGVKVSWQVTGIRRDPYAEEHRIPVEEDKPAEERGKYLQPGAYGLPADRGVDYNPPRAEPPQPVPPKDPPEPPEVDQ